MKKNSLILIITIGLLSSCSGNNASSNQVVKDVVSDSVVQTEEAKIEKGKLTQVNSFDPENTLEWTLDYAFYSCDQCELLPYQKQVNKQISRYFDEAHSTDRLDKKFFENVLDDFDVQQKEMNQDSDDPMAYEFIASVDILEDEDRVQIAFNQYNFLGGAHGSDDVQFVQVDKESGKILKLSDFISSRSKLDRIAEKYFRQQNELSMEGTLMDQGFDKEFSCNDNFYFKDGKLIFYFNQYEIACYAMGAFECAIPVQELGGVLTRKP